MAVIRRISVNMKVQTLDLIQDVWNIKEVVETLGLCTRIPSGLRG